RRVDTGIANARFFSIIAGVGLDADIMRKADRKLKDRVGFVAYIITAMKELTRKPERYSIRVDGKKATTYTAKSILVANVGKIAAGVQAVPKTDPQSGTFQIGIIQTKTWLGWMSLFIHASQGAIQKSPGYTLLSG